MDPSSLDKGFWYTSTTQNSENSLHQLCYSETSNFLLLLHKWSQSITLAHSQAYEFPLINSLICEWFYNSSLYKPVSNLCLTEIHASSDVNKSSFSITQFVIKGP